MQLEAGEPLRAQLSPDEQLLWAGRPAGGIRFQRMDLINVPFALFWCTLLFNRWKETQRGNWLFELPMGVFALFGFYFLVGRFIWDAYQRSQTHYGVTDQRVLTVITGLGSKIKSLPLTALVEITLKPGRDGSGTIAFAPSMAVWGSKGSTMSDVPELTMIEEANTAYQVILRAHRKVAQ